MRYIVGKSLIDLIASMMNCEEYERRCGTITVSYDFITGEKGTITLPVWDGKLKEKIK